MRLKLMRWAPRMMSLGAFASTFFRISRTQTATTSLRFTATKLRWRRIAPLHTMPCGAMLQTLWTDRLRPRAAKPYFPLRADTGKSGERRADSVGNSRYQIHTLQHGAELKVTSKG